jgi:hypothetical protein
LRIKFEKVTNDSCRINKWVGGGAEENSDFSIFEKINKTQEPIDAMKSYALRNCKYLQTLIAPVGT